MNARGFGFDDFNWLSASASAASPASNSFFGIRCALRIGILRGVRTHAQLPRGLITVHRARAVRALRSTSDTRHASAPTMPHRLFAFAQKIIEKRERRIARLRLASMSASCHTVFLRAATTIASTSAVRISVPARTRTPRAFRFRSACARARHSKSPPSNAAASRSISTSEFFGHLRRERRGRFAPNRQFDDERLFAQQFGEFLPAVERRRFEQQHA